MVMHRGKLRYTSKGSSGTLQALPDSCCARAMSYLELREVELVGECSLEASVRAQAPELGRARVGRTLPWRSIWVASPGDL